MAKRGQGEGTISKRPDGTWWARITVGRTPDGKQKRKAFYGKTRKEVQEKLTAALNDVNTGTYIEPSQMSVAQWMNIWFEQYKKNSLKISTFSHYRYYVEHYLFPEIGDCKLKDLRTDVVQKWVNSLHDRGLAYKTLIQPYSILYSALDQACRNEMLNRNVACNVILPKRNKIEIKALTTDEQARFIEACKQVCQGEMFLIALSTGLRRGEFLALTWSDIDFDNGLLYVNKAVVEYQELIGGGCKTTIKREIGTPKTGNSERCIPLLPQMVDILKQLKEKKVENQYDLIFPSKKGGILPSGTVVKRFKKILQIACIEDFHIHGLRHTYATRGIESGIDIKVMQELLGHSDIKMTANIYTHVLPENKKNSVLKLENSIMI